MPEATSHTKSERNPGAITGVMRGVSRRGPKVLRIGVVKDGHVVQERIVRDRSSVSVGSNERNLFVVKAREIPSRFELFQVKDGCYWLQFTDRMTGRIAKSSGTRTFEELKNVAQRTSHGFRVPLSDDMRGKVTIGDANFLFQFVTPPEKAPKPKLPVSVLRGAGGIDWRTTVIAGCSFLAHFLALSLLYSDLLDPVVDTQLKVKTLVEQIKTLPPPPPVEEKTQEEQTKDAKEKEEDKPEEKPKQVQKNPTKQNPEKSRLSTEEVAALSAELDSIDLDILATSSGLTATADVLSMGDSVSLAAMDRAAESGVGVSSGGPGGLKLTPAGGAIAVGEAGGGLQDVGAKGKTTEDTSGKKTKVAGPKGKAVSAGTSVTGRVRDANSVTSRMTAGFRSCYNSGLASNPEIEGRIQLRIQVGPAGEVQNVNASVTGNLPGMVVECIKLRARNARFQPPEQGAAVVSASYTFVRQ